jgi:hypothetical protein
MHTDKEQEIVQHGQEETNGIPRQIPLLFFRFSTQPHSSSKVPSSNPRTSVQYLSTIMFSAGERCQRISVTD